jgi:hypothetical protein
MSESRMVLRFQWSKAVPCQDIYSIVLDLIPIYLLLVRTIVDDEGCRTNRASR